MNRRSFLHKAVGLAGGAVILRASSTVAGTGGQGAESEGARYHRTSRIRKGEPLYAANKSGGTKESENRVILPRPHMGDIAVEQAMSLRRSRRSYSAQPLGLEDVSALLFAAQGLTGGDSGSKHRATPSAGALYPYDIYLFAHDAQGLGKGIYLYEVKPHGLTLLRSGDFRNQLKNACLNQRSVSEASIVIVMAAIFSRTTVKYSERGYRYVYIEAGCISQNIYLAAESLGLGTVAVGAFFDDRLNRLLDLDGVGQAAVLVQPIGKI